MNAERNGLVLRVWCEAWRGECELVRAPNGYKPTEKIEFVDCLPALNKGSYRQMEAVCRDIQDGDVFTWYERVAETEHASGMIVIHGGQAICTEKERWSSPDSFVS